MLTRYQRSITLATLESSASVTHGALLIIGTETPHTNQLDLVCRANYKFSVQQCCLYWEPFHLCTWTDYNLIQIQSVSIFACFSVIFFRNVVFEGFAMFYCYNKPILPFLYSVLVKLVSLSGGSYCILCMLIKREDRKIYS